ncbi:TRAP transporter large permease [Halalkalibacter oceani]|uniref:TRAP transporter large permease n=1 Tax=Halalkalibacter oceani TaxID=1653776 RepID=UPI003394FE0A
MLFTFLIVLIILFIIGMPVAFAMGFTSVFLMWLDGGIQYANATQRLMGGINSFVILAIPLFLLAGKLLSVGGIANRIFMFCRVCVGFLPGGLGHVNVTSSVLFSGMSGTAISDAAGLGPVVIKGMKDGGYDKGFASAVTAASSTIGPIIPPSLPLVIYGVAAGASVGALFLAGILPGIIMAIAMMMLVAYYAKKNNYPREARPTFPLFFQALKGAFLPLLTPIIIIGGIYQGIFTPTEAAVFAVLYALFLSMAVYRELSLKDLIGVLRETARDSAIIGLIVSMSTLFGNVIMRQRIPMEILDFFTASVDSAFVMLLILNLFLLLVGAFMETIAAITILVPIMLPIMQTFNIDPVHFGIIMVFNLMIGLLTPPFGMLLFVVSKIGDIDVIQLLKHVFPFLIVLFAVLLVITFFPSLVLWLPSFGS